MGDIAILGSGMAGLGAARRLREEGLDPVVFDKRPRFGGHTSSHTWQGFTFDEGPHVSFTRNERIQELFANNVDGRFETIHAEMTNYWKGHWIKHPAQVNLHGLPTELVVEVIKDFVAAHEHPTTDFKNYKEFLYASFGKTFAETFPMEYALKYHTTSADNMSTDWLGPRFYRPDLDEVLRGALAPNTAHAHYVDYFRYPTNGGFAAYLEPLGQATKVATEHEVVDVDTRAGRLQFANGTHADYEHLISSLPLKALIPRIADVPKDVIEATERLACSEVVLVNVAVGRADLLDAHWSYYYDRDIFFTRLHMPHLLSPNNAPPGCGSIQAECYYSSKYRPLDRTPEDCIEPVLRDLRKCGILRESDEILFTNAMHIPYANIIFDLDRAKAVETVHGYLRDVGIHPCGRYGDWGYLWTDEAFVSGEDAAERVIKELRR